MSTLHTLRELNLHYRTLVDNADLGLKPTLFPVNGRGLPKAFKISVEKPTGNSAHQELSRKIKIREALEQFQNRLKDFRAMVKDAGGELPQKDWAKNINLVFYPQSDEPILEIDIGTTRHTTVEGVEKIANLLNAHHALALKGPFQTYDVAQGGNSLLPYIVAADTPQNAYKRLCILLQDEPNSWRKLIMRQHIDAEAVRKELLNPSN
jgi:hypothetical protein